MKKLIASIFVTLDGFVSGPNGELDWMPGNGVPDKEVDQYVLRFLDSVDTMLLGRATYEVFVDFWPKATTADDLIADKFNAIPKVVFSSSLKSVNWGRWANARLAEGTPQDEMRRLKETARRDIVIFGSAKLVQSFSNLGLVDEYQLFVAPVVLGRGRRLFENIDDRHNLSLVDIKRFESGTALMSYAPSRNP
jgi:dihydrofolate reductase